MRAAVRGEEPTPSRKASQILEAVLSLPEGTEIELRAPVFKVYGEDLDFVLTEVRKKGCRRLIVDGTLVDISEKLELDESKVRHMDAVVDRLVVSSKHEKAIKAAIAATLLVGGGLLQADVAKGRKQKAGERRGSTRACATTHTTSSMGTSSPSILCSTIRRAPVRPAAAWESTS